MLSGLVRRAVATVDQHTQRWLKARVCEAMVNDVRARCDWFTSTMHSHRLPLLTIESGKRTASGH